VCVCVCGVCVWCVWVCVCVWCVGVCVCVCVCERERDRERESVCVALIIQHAMRMRRAILSPVTLPVHQHYSPLSPTGQEFKKKVFKIKRAFQYSLQICPQHFSF